MVKFIALAITLPQQHSVSLTLSMSLHHLALCPPFSIAYKTVSCFGKSIIELSDSAECCSHLNEYPI
jgi:hypothetical protein